MSTLSLTSKKEINCKSLENLVSILPGHVYWKDRNGIYMGCNDQQAKSYGLKSWEECIGKTDYELLLKEDADRVRKADMEVMNTGRMHIIEETGIYHGKAAIFLSQKVPLRDDEGNVTGLLGISFDITERKRAEAQLKTRMSRAEVALSNIIARMPGHVYWKDCNGIYLGCNDQQVKASGLISQKDIIGRTVYELLSKEDADRVRKVDLEVMETGKEHTVEEIGLYHGKETIFLSHKVPLVDQKGIVSGVLGISFDITDRKEAEKALAEQVKKTEQAYRSKTEFISAVSHEIRNPIGNVISLQGMEKDNFDKLKDLFYTDIIPQLNHPEKEALTKNVTQLFQKITDIHHKEQTEAHRSLNALQNLGELHRMQLTGVTTRFEENNIRELIDSAIKSSPYPNNDKVIFQTTIQPSVPVEAIIDYNNILAALSILIGNAIRFSPEKERIKINVDINPDKQSVLTIAIQDFGPGIHESQLGYLFGNFLDEKNEQKNAIYRKPSVQLPQAKMRLEASGGTLDIKSAPHEGTTVYVNIPYQLSKSAITAQKTEHQAAYILLIEDDAVTQQITREYLHEVSYRVDVVSNGRDAIKMALENDYDIALLDISLPDMDGLTVMQEVRTRKKDKIIFVGLTSHASEEDEEYFIEQGTMAVIKKPVDKNLLLQTMIAATNVKKTLVDR